MFPALISAAFRVGSPLSNLFDKCWLSHFPFDSLAGAIGCAVTHGALCPVDVVR